MSIETRYSPPTSVQELLQRYAEGERRFPDTDLDDAQFAGVKLESVVFDGSWFHSGNFQGTKLRGTSFERCHLKCANFRGADLRGASFRDSAVDAAEFDGALLEGMSFEGAGSYGYTVRDGDGFPNG
ncbi:MAG: pentapeptide repeat-containing protein [Planctomycetes bacterium]|nr:pentapeptide repeat-containing protein [Planctomycetota bacterium]